MDGRDVIVDNHPIATEWADRLSPNWRLADEQSYDSTLTSDVTAKPRLLAIRSSSYCVASRGVPSVNSS